MNEQASLMNEQASSRLTLLSIAVLLLSLFNIIIGRFNAPQIYNVSVYIEGEKAKFTRVADLSISYDSEKLNCRPQIHVWLAL